MSLPEELAPALPVEQLDGVENLAVVEEPERHLRAVPPRRRRQPRVGLWIGSIVSAASLFLLVAFNVFMVQGQFDLDRIAEQRTLEQKRYEKLRGQVAELSAPDSIVPRARALGLVDPTGTIWVNAPEAGAAKPSRDKTLTTQQQTYDGDAKSALDAGR